MDDLASTLRLAASLALVLLPATIASAQSETAPPKEPPAVPPAPATAFESVIAAPAAPAPPPAQRPVVVVRPPEAIVAPERRDACAVDEPTRSGFYLRFLGGAGYAKFSGTGPRGSVSATGLGNHSTIAIGGSIARGLAVAGTIQGTDSDTTFEGGPFSKATLTTDSTTKTASGKAKLSLAQIGVLVDWYPRLQSGFHGGLSAGLGALALSNNADDSKLAGTSVSGSAFVGYDTPIARSWALGITLVVSGVTSASLKNEDGDESGYKLHAFSIQLAASLLYF